MLIFLGTNDLADRYSLPPADIARAAVSLADTVRSNGTGPGGASPAALLLGLPRLGTITGFRDTMAGAAARAAELPRFFRRAADEAGVPLLDLAAVTGYSDLDGIHLDAAGHRAVALAAAERTRALLEPP